MFRRPPRPVMIISGGYTIFNNPHQVSIVKDGVQRNYSGDIGSLSPDGQPEIDGIRVTENDERFISEEPVFRIQIGRRQRQYAMKS